MPVLLSYRNQSIDDNTCFLKFSSSLVGVVIVVLFQSNTIDKHYFFASMIENYIYRSKTKRYREHCLLPFRKIVTGAVFLVKIFWLHCF